MNEDLINNESLLVKLCEDYYLNDINISELAKKYDLSRYRVMKYIEEAKEKQVVTISINSPHARNYDLENIFKKYFSTTNVYILKDTEDVSNQDLFFSKFVADYTQSFIQQSKIVALSWGDSVFKVIDQFKKTQREDLVFTQFIGEIGKYNSLAGSTRLVQKAADCYESSYLTLSIPLYIINDTARELMSLEPLMAKTLSTAAHADILISGIGTPSSIESVDSWNNHKNLLFPNMNECVGFLYGRPFNDQGEFINSEDKTFGLTLKEVFVINKRIGICNSKFKSVACLGALRGHFFTDLFLDEKTAWKILGLIKE
ncbi:sugar-binding transcriptional regulator [Vagococcus hydrophili]|uniref:DNA-binding transcriptional regulator n=1 Tax=Vagococcus hydrophili TaxID=2714947 RepID=A0A6G8AU43_9ENTE|nr:sugar-binding domain-containing protein [Vagococcus hydrophili]QIL48601.1 DNA-binding transcriptional regulator [Vagococcus hydrophili]